MADGKMKTGKSLWERICRAELPAGTGQTFADRLAVTERMSQSEAEDVVTEYRRFLYLAAIAEAPRVPSELVGLAWRLHAMQPAYLSQFCPNVIGRPLPYVPGHHDEAEWVGDKRPVILDEVDLDIAYSRARIDYAVEFGQTAPKSIWPVKEAAPEIRALAASAGALVLSAVLSALAEDIRIIEAGAILSFLVFFVVSNRTRDSRGWRSGAFDQIRGGF